MADTDLNRNRPGEGGNTFSILGKMQGAWLGDVSPGASSAPSALPSRNRNPLAGQGNAW